MSDVLIDQDTMEDIGDSIRSKLGVQTTYLPSEMPSAIMSISGGGNEMELTKAEYDALSEAEKTNGTTYYITDAQSWTSKEVQPVIYSTNEREIGVWTDGKPLYAKTVSFSITVGNGYTRYTHNIANITPIAVEGEIHSSTDDIIYTSGANAAAHLSFGFSIDTVYLYQTSSYFNGWNARATLYYTKTTDQAGSGIYTPQGQLAVHYSTEEHVIGTWIDGKPLYEKTITGTTSATSDNTILANLQGIDNVVNMTGYIKGTGRIITSYVNSSNYVSFYYSTETYNLIVWHPNSATFHGKETAVTIQYTKTTD